MMNEPLMTGVFIRKTKNIGDKTCGPLLYYGMPGFRVVNVDIDEANINGDVLIVGGGGLFWGESGTKKVSMVLNDCFKLKIFWGGGVGVPLQKPSALEVLSRFDLVGIRDVGVGGYETVPCPSCKSRFFDESGVDVAHEFVCYEHHEIPMPISGFPKMTNSELSLRSVVRFFMSAETILTNSYHGAYWGTLLGKKVVFFTDASHRYTSMKFRPERGDKDDWRSATKRAPVYPEALTECRNINDRFMRKVVDAAYDVFK
jgi:hypothetical protein